MCRFVDTNTILLAEITEEEAASRESLRISKERLDAAYEVLKNETDGQGKPFKIIRMPVPEILEFDLAADAPGTEMLYMSVDENRRFPDGFVLPELPTYRYCVAAGYCNFLISNGVVLGQKYWHPGWDEKIKEKDERAESILKQCFPDREVIMIDTYELNVTGGGVHCWTKNI